MVDSIQQTTASDVASVSKTINDYESGKITQDQATTAFHDELNQVDKHNDVTQVEQSFNQTALKSPLAPVQTDPVENPTYLPKEFPGLTLTSKIISDDQSEIAVNNPQNNRRVDLVLQPYGEFATPYVASATDLQNDKTHVYAEKVAATANDYFTGKINAATTDADINQELKTALAAGVDLTNTKTLNTVLDNSLGGGVDFDGRVSFSSETKNGSTFLGINAEPVPGQNISLKRIEIIGGQAKAQDVSDKVFWKTEGTRTFIGAAGGGLIGAFASPIGAAVGAGVGAVAGAVEGAVKYSQHQDQNTEGQLIFDY
jgi:hypothetical protein